MKAIMSLVLLSFLAYNISYGQFEPASSKEDFEKKYKWRIKQEQLNGVYIPKDLNDAFVQLTRLTDKEIRTEFKSKPEELVRQKLHATLGRWIIHNWGFDGGSRLSHFLKGLNIHHPDDMAQFIITTYHRSLNRKTLDVKGLIAEFEERKAKRIADRLEKGTVIHTETRIREKNDTTGN